MAKKIKVSVRYNTSHGEVESIKAIDFFYNHDDVYSCGIEEIEVDVTTYALIIEERDRCNWVDPESK